MRIKRFEASDTYSAMAMVKEELGEDAVILSTRSLGGGKGRGGARIEVIAAMEYDQNFSLTGQESTGPPEGRPRRLFGYQAAPETKNQAETSGPSVQDIAGGDAFAGKLADQLAGRTQPEKNPDSPVPHFEANDLRQRFANFLRRQNQPEVDSAHSTGGAAGIKSKPDPQQVAKWRDRIIGQLQIIPFSINRNRSIPAVMALTGPTGVGKTTTAAKIAAWYSIHEGLKVTLLSMDCYRIGATDQLRAYARIMRLPCEITLRKKDLPAALARHRDKDLIIIDTAGKSPYDPEHVRELGEWFSLTADIKPYLVLSATCKKEDMQQIISAYKPLNLEGLVIAKLDETRAYASLCQMLAAAGLPVSGLCTGQRVPEDFLLASRDFMQTLFAQGWGAAADELAVMTRGSWAQ